MKRKKIVIQGVEGCFHHIAANAYYGENVDIVVAENFPRLIDLVKDENVCDAGIMAIENSIAGSILQNYGLMQDANLEIEGEIYLRIKQNLLALPEQSIEDLKEVHSHPMAINQCRAFFRNYPHIRLVETEDTAISARNIRENNLKGVGAIAGELSAELYKLKILKKQIESIKNNQTRFFLLKRKQDVSFHGGYNKASLYFSIAHEVGSLANILEIFTKQNVNLSKIQSIPIAGVNWEYFFHVDIEFEAPIQFTNTIKEMEKYTTKLQTLGTYTKGIVVK